jgi:molybdopterin-containing oxidoreductase family iron-sulfur binding subunit
MSPLIDNSTVDRFWRNLDEQASSLESVERSRADIPEAASRQWEGIDRRQFSRLMAASLALAGATISGCRRWPVQHVRPQVTTTEGSLPGVPEYFATIFELGGVATGILAKSMDGRPIKIEGNSAHPFSLGAAGVFAQASVLELYDPERSREYVYRPSNGSIVSSEKTQKSTPALRQTRQEFEKLMAGHFADLRKRQGAGLHFLSQSTSSPTYSRLRGQIQTAFPKSTWHRYDPIDRDNELAGAKLAFGQAVRCQYHLDQASTIVCLSADLLGSHPGHQRWCRAWARGRQPDSKSFNRLIAVESGYSITGAAADIRQPLRPSQIANLVAYIVGRMGLVTATQELDESTRLWADGLLHELQTAGAGSLLVAGPALSPEMYACVHAINYQLGCFGRTVTFTEEPLGEGKESVDSLGELCGALRGGTVDSLIILDGNPVYDAPAKLQLELSSPRPDKSLISLYLGLYDNETSRRCTWHVPAAHSLESWGDGRAWDGIYSIQQPLIQPLYDGMSAIELMSLINGQAVANGLELVRQTARATFHIDDEARWQTLLHDGVLPDSQFQTINVRQPLVRDLAPRLEDTGFEVCFVQDTKTYDGRFANNGWLQELPDPLTKLTWGNAALISKADADQLKISNGDEIKIEFGSELVLTGIPALIQPGQASGCVSISVGYGRSCGHIANNVGTDVYPMRSGQERFVAGGAKICKTGRQQQLAVTQDHHLIDRVGEAGRNYRVGDRHQPGSLVRETTLRQHHLDSHGVHRPFHIPQPAPMFDPPNSYNTPHSWGMAIDLNSCIGCSACVVACQAENNIPIVGKENVIRNREMHWIRIDRYFKGDVGSPDVVHVPVACAHCEDAPCEQVCPVAATLHDSEGLNSMVYNRCVGTRYCSNNCPYKVRRFNYFDYHALDPKAPARPWMKIPDQQTDEATSRVKQLAFNPDVTVRMRGVMEKCTYCVQRLTQARHHAKLELANGQRDTSILRDGEVVTACQQACPTNAISFGDLNDKGSHVSTAHNDARAYAMLGELNIKPRTQYLARIRNVEQAPADSTQHE